VEKYRFLQFVQSVATSGAEGRKLGRGGGAQKKEVYYAAHKNIIIEINYVVYETVVT